MLASMSSTQGLSSTSRTECIRAGRIHAVLLASSMRSSARRSASSLTTLFMPSVCAATASPRSAVMWAYRRCPASSPSISVPSMSRLLGALPLLYASGHADTQRSNTPVVARNSAKKTNWPCGVADAPASQRTCMRPPKVSTTCVSSAPPTSTTDPCRLRLLSPIG